MPLAGEISLRSLCSKLLARMNSNPWGYSDRLLISLLSAAISSDSERNVVFDPLCSRVLARNSSFTVCGIFSSY